jgi:branched-chain amino acid transport system substrate-binding protein
MKRTMILLILGLLILPSACARKPKHIMIGIALSAVYHRGALLAMNEINASGGIGGVPIELLGLDWKVVDQFNAPDILRWASQFAEEKDLVAVIGHSDSSSTLSAAAYYNQHQVPQIVTIATNPSITNIGVWTYRLCLSDAAQGPALADYAMKDWGKRRIAVFYVNDDYGRGLAQLFEQRVREQGGEIISTIMHRNSLEEDDKELIRATVAALKKKDPPDLLVLFQRTEAAKFTLRAIREAGLTSGILGGDSLAPLEFTKSNPELVEGLRISQFFLPHDQDPQAAHFVKAFKEFAGRDPDYGDAFAYDAVYLMRDAVVGGGATREGVKSYLDRLIRDRTQQTGAGGNYTLGQDHDARRSLYIVEAHNGVQTFLKTLRVE